MRRPHITIRGMLIVVACVAIAQATDIALRRETLDGNARLLGRWALDAIEHWKP